MEPALLGGIIGILAGLVILGHPIVGAVFTMAALFVIAAAGGAVSGLTNILAGSKRDSDGSWAIGRFFLGVLQVAIGVVVLWYPLFGTVALRPEIPLSLVAIAGGVGAIGFSLGGRRKRRK